MWKAVRRESFRWWGRVGAWWLVAIALCEVCCRAYVYLATQTSHNEWWLSFLTSPLQLAIVAAWLHAASVMDGLAVSAYRSMAAPLPGGVLRARFWFAYAQGALPVGLAFALECLGNLVPSIRVGSSGFVPTWLDVIHQPVLDAACVAWQMTWFVALLVIVPTRRWLSWNLRFLPVVVTLPIFALQAAQPYKFYHVPGSIMLHAGEALGASAVLVMLAAYRRERWRTSSFLYWSLFGSALFGPYLQLGRNGVAMALSCIAGWISTPLYAHPYPWPSLATFFANTYSYRSIPILTISIWADSVLVLLWSLLWLVAALKAIDAWILAPERSRPAAIPAT